MRFRQALAFLAAVFFSASVGFWAGRMDHPTVPPPTSSGVITNTLSPSTVRVAALPAQTTQAPSAATPGTPAFTFIRADVGNGDQACLSFSGAIATAPDLHLSDYVQVELIGSDQATPQFALNSHDNQICLSGLKAGSAYKITL